MKTVTLKTLVRELCKVKQLTRAGEKVRVTDKGKPLWIIQAAANDLNEADRIKAIDRILDEVLAEKASTISTAQLVIASRR